MAGSPGFDFKLLGALLLAGTWIFITLTLLGVFAGNGSGNVSDNDPFASLYRGLVTFAFIHATGFSLIAIGWIMERSENLTEVKPKKTFAERRSKIRKMIIETPDRDVEKMTPEKKNEMKKFHEDDQYYPIQQDGETLPPPLSPPPPPL